MVMGHERMTEWVRARTMAKSVEFIAELPGATTSRLHVLRADDRELVLRVYDRHEVTDENPMVAQWEAESLTAARKALGPLVPELLAVDAHGSVCGRPILLMTRLPGCVVLRDVHLDLFVQPLAALHRSPVPDNLRAYEPWFDRNQLHVPEWSAHRQAWRTLIDVALGLAPQAEQVHLHRDYHPANVLWQDGRTSAIVDWTWSCIGPAGVDLAHCRTNVAILDSIHAADDLLRAYQHQRPGYTHDIYWDACQVVGFDPVVMTNLNPFGAQLTAEQARIRLDQWVTHLAEHH
jgi:aminoglycoside phosphotransferase (APT) family kinase protein